MKRICGCVCLLKAHLGKGKERETEPRYLPTTRTRGQGSQRKGEGDGGKYKPHTQLPGAQADQEEEVGLGQENSRGALLPRPRLLGQPSSFSTPTEGVFGHNGRLKSSSMNGETVGVQKPPTIGRGRRRGRRRREEVENGPHTTQPLQYSQHVKRTVALSRSISRACFLYTKLRIRLLPPAPASFHPFTPPPLLCLLLLRVLFVRFYLYSQCFMLFDLHKVRATGQGRPTVHKLPSQHHDGVPALDKPQLLGLLQDQV